MSRDTHLTWAYQVVGRNIELYELAHEGSLASSGQDRVKPLSDAGSKVLKYPSESITNGLMFEGTAFIEPFVEDDPNELDESSSNPESTEVLAPDETSHVNVNRMFSLAIVDYLKAMAADKAGDLATKEYYMKEFWKKAGDAQSNKFGVFVGGPSSLYSIR